MAQRQVASTKASNYSFGIELECCLPQTAILQHGIRIGGYHHGIQLPAPFPQGWTAERDASIQATRPGHVGVEIVSPVLKGAEGIAQVKAVAKLLRDMGGAVNSSTGCHVHIGAASVVQVAPTSVPLWGVGALSEAAVPCPSLNSQ